MCFISKHLIEVFPTFPVFPCFITNKEVTITSIRHTAQLQISIFAQFPIPKAKRFKETVCKHRSTDFLDTPLALRILWCSKLERICVCVCGLVFRKVTVRGSKLFTTSMCRPMLTWSSSWCAAYWSRRLPPGWVNDAALLHAEVRRQNNDHDLSWQNGSKDQHSRKGHLTFYSSAFKRH